MEAKTESDGDFLARIGTDGAKWAAEFRRIARNLGYSDMDEGWLIGWFANAIEAGGDRERWRHSSAAELYEALRRATQAMADDWAGNPVHDRAEILDAARSALSRVEQTGKRDE